MSVHDENNATVYKCKNCNQRYTDHFSKEDIQKHTSGQCIRKTRVINIKTKEPYDVYCGRESLYYGLKESLFCNPFKIGQDGDRDEVLEKFKNYFYKRLGEDDRFNYELWKLKGRVLACWCVPEKCHCQIIADFLDKNDKKEEYWLKGVLDNIKKKRVAIVGSRNYNNRAEIYKYLDSKIDKIGHLVSGGCPSGPDRICQDFTKDRGLSITIHYPNWDRDGRGAGFIRNKRIVEDCDVLIAWQANKSKGTQNSINLARKLNKQVIVFEVEPDNAIKEPKICPQEDVDHYS